MLLDINFKSPRSRQWFVFNFHETQIRQYFSVFFFSFIPKVCNIFLFCFTWHKNMQRLMIKMSLNETKFFTYICLHSTYLIEILDCKSNHSGWLHQFQIHTRIFHMFSYVTYDLSFLYKHFQSPGKVAVTKGNWVIQLLSYNMTIKNHINALIHTHQQCRNHVSIIRTCERTSGERVCEWVSERMKMMTTCRYFI